MTSAAPASRSARAPLVVVAIAAVLGAWGYWQYSRPVAPADFQGWIEAYFIYVSPDEAGRVETLAVREGDQVATGQLLFMLDSDLQKAAVAEAEATLANTRISLDRARELLKRAVGSQKTFDDAEAAQRTAEARLNSARTKLDRRRMVSPVTGTVQEVYFRAGEMVQAGRPIVSLLPPGNTRVRFFVPQAMLPLFHLGDTVAIRCDGCAGDLTAKVNFISPQAEFTPPVIYSQEERARLVFRIEAIPDAPDRIRVGQPVTIVQRANPAAPAQPAAGLSKEAEVPTDVRR